MSEPNFRVELADGPDLAEFAEALDITTTEVFSVMPRPEGGIVVYTPGVTEENVETVDAFMADLRRDDEGILRVFGEPSLVPDFFEKILAAAQAGDDGTR